MDGAIIGGVSMLAGLFSDFIERIDDRESSSFGIPLLFELKCESLDSEPRLLKRMKKKKTLNTVSYSSSIEWKMKTV